MRQLTVVRAALIGAAVTLGAQTAAGQVLIVNGASVTSEPGTTSSITTQLTTLHTAVGNAVTVANTLPADLTPFRQIWDIRFSNASALTPTEQSTYLSFLQGGGGIFLMGENSGFMPRNNSLFSFINLAGGGSVGFGSGPDVQQACSPFNGPSAISTVDYAAPGWFSSRGTGQWITAPNCATSTGGGSGIAWAVGTLANAPAGALTSILDVNFMQTTAEMDNQNLTRNLVGFVGQQVPTSPVPEPSTVVLSATGLLALAGVAARRRRQGV